VALLHGHPRTHTTCHPVAPQLAVLDWIPIVEHLDRADARCATAWWHWFFFAQPEKPERAIGADPDAWYGALAPGRAGPMGAENRAVFRRAIADPATVRAMLEDYRAGLTVDRAAEEAEWPRRRRASWSRPWSRSSARDLG
jgi:haloacetate dehalogenase